jgi:hypothetical protein
MARLAIFAIVEKNHVLMKWNETGQDDDSEATRHEGLGCGSIPSMLLKDRFLEPFHVHVERMPLS